MATSSSAAASSSSLPLPRRSRTLASNARGGGGAMPRLWRRSPNPPLVPLRRRDAARPLLPPDRRRGPQRRPAAACPRAVRAQGQRWEGGGGAARSHVPAASPPMCKSKTAPGAAPRMELLRFHPFGRAPPGAGVGAALGALPNGGSFSHAALFEYRRH